MRKLKFILLIFIITSCSIDDIPIIEEEDEETEITTEEEKENIEDGMNFIYDNLSLAEINLEFSTEEWNKILMNYDQNPYNEEYISGDCKFSKNGTQYNFNNIGLRLRGNTSRRRPEGKKGESHNPTNPDWHHASFSLKTNRFVKGQKIKGVEKINLKWFKDDAMYVREIYCYELFKRFGVWTAPVSAYCKLSIKIKEDNNDVYYGIYEMVEPVDSNYLIVRKNKFNDTNGFLWKANWGADLVNASKSNMNLENITLTQTYTPVYDLKTNTQNLTLAQNQLADFITKLNSKSDVDFKSWIDQAMDVPLFLKSYAVNVMCGMWDDYWNNKNNFYLYFDSNSKFYFIPFDYDNTLGTSLLMTDSGTKDVLNWGNNSYLLVKKIISIPEYEQLYINYIHELVSSENDFFNADKSISRIKNWQNMISPYISNDTGEDMSLIDQPASWGNCSFYRLLESNNNFFKIRSKNIPE